MKQQSNRGQEPRRIKWGFLIAGLILLALGLMGVGAPKQSQASEVTAAVWTQI